MAKGNFFASKALLGQKAQKDRIEERESKEGGVMKCFLVTIFFSWPDCRSCAYEMRTNSTDAMKKKYFRKQSGKKAQSDVHKVVRLYN